MPFNQINWTMPTLLLPLIALPVSMLYALSGLPYADNAALIVIATIAYLIFRLLSGSFFIGSRIRLILGPMRGWPVHTKNYPLYKFVDIYRGVQAYAARHNHSIEIASTHNTSLAALLTGQSGFNHIIRTPIMVSRKIGYERDTFLPADTFWLLRPERSAPIGPSIVRLRFTYRTVPLQLEVATQQPAAAAKIMEEIAELALAHSIYRNHTIRVVFGPEVRGGYGDEESLEPIDLVFHQEQPINDDDIILDETVRSIIERTVIDFHQRRAMLMQLGLPGRRGVLFYGPPGTGKTYTCKYITHRLASATTIVATGHALLHMKSICTMARMFQPALVLLEDVDLVFANRETNAHNTVLGEFIDQLDGFGETDQVVFIMTTNAIERIEAAIKDRPGRVSQCIYFGPPNATLRRRYLCTLLRPYDTTAVDIDSGGQADRGGQPGFSQRTGLPGRADRHRAATG